MLTVNDTTAPSDSTGTLVRRIAMSDVSADASGDEKKSSPFVVPTESKARQGMVAENEFPPLAIAARPSATAAGLGSRVHASLP
jgi:hypothetical protein